MRRLRNHLFVALVLAIAAAGCTPVRYEYTPPATADGRACADQCAGARQLCESRARIMDQQCRAHYQVQMVQYTMCRQSGRRPLCLAPDACPGPAYAPCTRDFNDCFADCGGQVHEIEVDDSARPRLSQPTDPRVGCPRWGMAGLLNTRFSCRNISSRIVFRKGGTAAAG